MSAIALPSKAHEVLSFFNAPLAERRHATATSAAEAMASGGLVDDSVVTNLLQERLAEDDAMRGWVVDGFPRTQAQAKLLVEMNGLRPDVVIEMVVDYDEIRERVLYRRFDPVTSKVYNLVTNSPRDAAVLARLERRGDDSEEVLERRLETYDKSVGGIRETFRAGGIEVVGVRIGHGAGVEEIADTISEAVGNGRRVVLMGAPGCGKGTQGIALADIFGGVHISTGDLLRQGERRRGMAAHGLQWATRCSDVSL